MVNSDLSHSASLLLAFSAYVSIFKTAFVLANFIGWCFCMQWLDRDSVRVKTIREKWVFVGLFSGTLGLFAWLMIPWNNIYYFLSGWGIYAFVVGGGIFIYISHRNKRVSAQYRVLTGQHFAKLLWNKKDEKLDRSQHEYRVRLFDQHKKSVRLPEAAEEAKQFSTTQEMLYDALWRRASEIDIAISGDSVKLVYSIDGVSAERRDLLSQPQACSVISYIKGLAGLSLEEKRRPQKGQIRAGLLSGMDPALVEVYTSGTTAGERMSMKVLSSESLLPFDQLGIHPQRQEALLKIFLEAPKGVVICSGPPQSGITTTLYAIIKKHDAYIQNIHSLEKRRLTEVDNITQHSFDPTNKELSYARQLQSVLRREPDVAMIGECDDKETAVHAVRASKAGKKIYIGLTANDAFEAIEIFMGWVGDRKLIAGELLAVINQRLVRKLCPTCREAYRPDARLLRKANLPIDKIEHFYRPPTQKVYDKQGREIVCPTCQGTGYYARTGVFEVVFVDSNLREIILAGANTTQIKAQARKNKMFYLQEEGLLKTMEGTTSINEMLRSLRQDGGSRR